MADGIHRLIDALEIGARVWWYALAGPFERFDMNILSLLDARPDLVGYALDHAGR